MQLNSSCNFDEKLRSCFAFKVKVDFSGKLQQHATFFCVCVRFTTLKDNIVCEIPLPKKPSYCSHFARVFGQSDDTEVTNENDARINSSIFPLHFHPDFDAMKVVFLTFAFLLLRPATSVPFIVQTLSSNYAIVLGGYGPGYEELRQVEVVKHDRVCPNIIR